MKCQARAECRPGTQSLGATPGAKTRMLSIGDEPGKARPQPEPRTATRDIGSEARGAFTPGSDCIALGADSSPPSSRWRGVCHTSAGCGVSLTRR